MRFLIPLSNPRGPAFVRDGGSWMPGVTLAPYAVTTPGSRSLRARLTPTQQASNLTGDCEPTLALGFSSGVKPIKVSTPDIEIKNRVGRRDLAAGRHNSHA